MSRSNDPLTLSPNWHVDYRIEAELPEDTIIGTRFLINAAFTVPLLVALYFAGWKGSEWWDLSEQIQYWQRRIDESKTEVKPIDDMHKDLVLESMKIDQAYALMRPQLIVSEFVDAIGRTRPEQISIDLMEWNDAGVLLRGGLREKSEQATRIVGSYVDTLRKDEKIKPLFESIQLTDFDRGSGGELQRFEIKLVPKERK